MRTLRSTHAKRRAPVRKRQLVRTKVKTRHHRRFAGVRGQGPNLRRGKPRINKTGRHRVFKGRKKSVLPRRAKGTAPVRTLKGRHGPRRFLGRKKSTTKRVMRKGLKRTFKGRKKVTMRKGLHRTFKGRKKSTKPRKKPVFTHPRKKPSRKVQQAAINTSSYISMF